MNTTMEALQNKLKQLEINLIEETIKEKQEAFTENSFKIDD